LSLASSLPLHLTCTRNGIDIPFVSAAADSGSAAVKAVLYLPGEAAAPADAHSTEDDRQVEAVMDSALSLSVHACGTADAAYHGGLGAGGGGKEGFIVPENER
jgi:hypothetical protein